MKEDNEPVELYYIDPERVIILEYLPEDLELLMKDKTENDK